jgi:ABC-type branched-subunit amino acid transport system substrate-binding protein
MGALSGSLAFVGTPYRDGALAYIQYVNAHGGAGGHQIVTKVQDHQGTGNLAVAAVTQLAQQDNVLGIIDAGGTAATGALTPTLNQFQVPLVGQSCLPAQVFDPMTTKYCFLSGTANTAMATAQINYALQLKPNAKVVLVPTNNPYGQEWAPFATKLAQSKGASILATEFVPLTGVDMSAAVNSVVNSKPDVIVTVLSDPQMVSFGQGLAQRGLQTTPVVNYNGGNAKATFQTLNNPNFYAMRIFPFPEDQSTDGMKQAVAAFGATSTDPGIPFILEGYFAAHILVTGLTKCGDGCTREKLASTLDTLTVPMNGLAPDPFSFASNNHLGLNKVGVYQLKNGPNSVPALVASVGVK